MFDAQRAKAGGVAGRRIMELEQRLGGTADSAAREVWKARKELEVADHAHAMETADQLVREGLETSQEAMDAKGALDARDFAYKIAAEHEANGFKEVAKYLRTAADVREEWQEISKQIGALTDETMHTSTSYFPRTMTDEGLETILERGEQEAHAVLEMLGITSSGAGSSQRKYSMLRTFEPDLTVSQANAKLNVSLASVG